MYLWQNFWEIKYKKKRVLQRYPNYWIRGVQCVSCFADNFNTASLSKVAYTFVPLFCVGFGVYFKGEPLNIPILQWTDTITTWFILFLCYFLKVGHPTEKRMQCHFTLNISSNTSKGLPRITKRRDPRDRNCLSRSARLSCKNLHLKALKLANYDEHKRLNYGNFLPVWSNFGIFDKPWIKNKNRP